MGLDFGIQRKRDEPGYESSAWKDVAWWRNCYEAKDVILKNIGSYDPQSCTAFVSIETLELCLEELVDYISEYNFYMEKDNDQLYKLFKCVSDIATIIQEDMVQYEKTGYSYAYKIIDSY